MDNSIIECELDGASFRYKDGKLLSLILVHEGQQVQVCSGSVEGSLGDGSYLMYPWVNRVSEDGDLNPKYRDGNGIGLHGLYCDVKRIVVEQGSGYVKMRPVEYDARFPEFVESFRLVSKSEFMVCIDVVNVSMQTQQFGLGYHPYLQIGNRCIDQMRIGSNLNSRLEVDDRLLPLDGKLQWVDVQLDGQEIGDQQFDNGFRGEQDQQQSMFVELQSERVRLRIKYGRELFGKDENVIDMNVWQIYTPPDRVRIAIEPQTCTVDGFKQGKMKELLSQESAVSGFIIQLY